MCGLVCHNCELSAHLILVVDEIAEVKIVIFHRRAHYIDDSEITSYG